MRATSSQHESQQSRLTVAPLRSTLAFTLTYGGANLALAWFRIDVLQRYDARWPAELSWAVEVVTWPFLVLMGAVLFSIGASVARCRIDPWRRAAVFGLMLAVLVCAPYIVGATASPPLNSWLTWALVVAGPLAAGTSLDWASWAVARRGVTSN